MTSSHDLKAKWYEKLRIVNDMNDSRPSTEGSLGYEKLRVVVDMNDFVS